MTPSATKHGSRKLRGPHLGHLLLCVLKSVSGPQSPQDLGWCDPLLRSAVRTRRCPLGETVGRIVQWLQCGL